MQYQYRDDYCLPLMIPMETAINKEEVTAFASKQALNVGNENKRYLSCFDISAYLLTFSPRVAIVISISSGC